MHQPDLALVPAPATAMAPAGAGPATAEAAPLQADRLGFELGWAHAQHGLTPPAALLQESTPVDQGWRAGRAVMGRRHVPAPAAVRAWLALRLLAWQQGAPFDLLALTPASLAKLRGTHCPVRRQLLGGASGAADAPVVHPLDPRAGYCPGNLIVLSRLAAEAAQDCSVDDALGQARVAQAEGAAVQGLHAVEWLRLAVLLSWTQDLPFAAAARLPALLSAGETPSQAAVQRLQARVTRWFQQPGWSARARHLAAALPAESSRTDFHLFVSALASRVLHAAGEMRTDHGQASGVRRGLAISTWLLEDAWLHPQVQRRWAQLALGLGEAGCARLLREANNSLADGGRAALRPAATSCPRTRAAASDRVTAPALGRP